MGESPKHKHRSDAPVYMSYKRQQYDILRDKLGMWYIHGFRQTIKPVILRGTWQKFADCEKVLIDYLKSHDRLRRAVYPGSNVKSTNQQAI